MPRIQKRQVLKDRKKILTPQRVSESYVLDHNKARIAPDGSVSIKASCSKCHSVPRS